MTLPLEVVLAALAALAAIGWISGFLGIGGGFLIIPVLVWVGGHAGLSDVLALKQAMGTALLISTFTALSGFLVHRKRSGVAVGGIVPLAGGVAVGGFAGARVGAGLLGPSLFPLFGAALILVAIVFATRRERGRDDEFPRGPGLVFIGLPIGFAAALVGLGGAVFTGLVFSGLLGFPIRRVASTTSLAQVCGAALGCVGWAWGAWWGVPGTAPGSVGYVNLPVGLLALLLTWPLARLGARSTHRSPPGWVRIVFAVALVALGVRFFLKG